MPYYLIGTETLASAFTKRSSLLEEKFSKNADDISASSISAANMFIAASQMDNAPEFRQEIRAMLARLTIIPFEMDHAGQFAYKDAAIPSESAISFDVKANAAIALSRGLVYVVGPREREILSATEGLRYECWEQQ